MDHELKIRTEERHPFAIVQLEGELAGISVYQLKHEFNRLIEYFGHNRLVLDLGQVSFVDSGGIGVIVHGYQACKQMGGKFVCVKPAFDQALHSLYQASLERFVDFYPDKETALEKLCETSGLNIPPSLIEKPAATHNGTSQSIKELERRMEKLENALEKLIELHQQKGPQVIT